jgi:nucleolar protein 14
VKKLQRKVKQERKGAIRELRKDNMFLEEERLKEKLRRDKELKEKLGGLRSLLEQQEHDVRP